MELSHIMRKPEQVLYKRFCKKSSELKVTLVQPVRPSVNGRWVDLVAPNAVRPDKACITIPGPAPKYGQDTRMVPSRLGFTEDEIQRMIESGAASDGWSEKYLPE